MRIADVDLVATSGSSMMHRAAPQAKLASFAFVVAAALTNNNVLVLAGLCLALAAVAVAAALPMRTVVVLAAYPVFFAGVFAATTSIGILDGAVIVLKALATGSAALIVVFTTPYPQILAPVQRHVPRVLSDALLLTYRSLFLIAQKSADLLRAVRLRAGLRGAGLGRTARSAALALGGLLLYSLDLSQRTYDVMRLRGYEERLVVGPPATHYPAASAAVVSGGLALFAIAVVFRLAWTTMNPMSWIVVPAGLAAFAIALAWRAMGRGAS